MVHQILMYVSVGTIFSVFRRKSDKGTPVQLEDFLQKDNQVASGYLIYGSSTMLVYTTGNGVNGFTFDPGIGVFFLSHPNMKIPKMELFILLMKVIYLLLNNLLRIILLTANHQTL